MPDDYPDTPSLTKPTTTLATPCRDCGHSYNWHRDGRCTVTAGPNGCGCGGFTAFHDEPAQATEPTCLPDCQGDCPVCLPPEEYDKLHGKTTNAATLSSVLHYEAGQADERARIVRIIEGRKKPHPCVWNEWMDDLLAAIRGDNDERA